jgi:hypothetical protein
MEPASALKHTGWLMPPLSTRAYWLLPALSKSTLGWNARSAYLL